MKVLNRNLEDRVERLERKAAVNPHIYIEMWDPGPPSGFVRFPMGNWSARVKVEQSKDHGGRSGMGPAPATGTEGPTDE